MSRDFRQLMIGVMDKSVYLMVREVGSNKFVFSEEDPWEKIEINNNIDEIKKKIKSFKIKETCYFEISPKKRKPNRINESKAFIFMGLINDGR